MTIEQKPKPVTPGGVILPNAKGSPKDLSAPKTPSPFASSKGAIHTPANVAKRETAANKSAVHQHARNKGRVK